MARTKKEAALTPEERLQAALVPDWEWPYKLPGNWCWTRITVITDILNGFAFKSQHYSSAGIRIIRITNVQDGFIQDKKPVYYPLVSQKEITPFMLKDGDFLMSLTGNVGRVAIIDASFLPAALNQRVACLRIKSEDSVRKEYIFYFCLQKQFVSDCIKSAKGSAQLNMSTEWLKEYPIPLPPLAEQQRIVDRIESLFAKLDEAKEKAQAVVDSFETRKAAILHKAFTGELTVKWREEHGVGMESWEKHLLSTVSSLQTGLMKGKKYTGKTVELPYLRVANVQDGFLRLDEIKKIDVEENAISRYSLAVGDVLFTEGGDFDKLGRGTVWEGQIKNCLHQNHIFVVRPNPEVLNPYFLSYQAGSRYGKAYFLSCSKQTTNLASINSTQLKNFPVLIPSMMEQEVIIRLLDSSLEKEQQTKNIAESVLDQIDLMKKSILARAFRGELGTNDPSEESAIELLKKVLHTSAEPKSKTKRKFIPQKIEAQIKTDLERKIIMAFIQNDTAIMPIQQLMSISSRKFDIIETLRNLQERGILLKENDTYKLMG